MAQTAMTQSAREAALNRRRALTSTGKAALTGMTQGSSAANLVPSGQASSQSGSTTTKQGGSARAASRARREAMSVSGKAGVTITDRTREATSNMTPPASTAESERIETGKGCGCGCNGTKASCDTQPASEAQSATAAPRISANVHKNIARSSSRAASLARRQAMSAHGKAGINTKNSSAQVARAANPHLSSRELAKTLREQRSRNGKTGDKKSQPCGRLRPKSQAESGAAQDAPWKVGASETAHGQTLTGTMVGRNRHVTGDEPSTCRTVTGTEYLGADIFREFCQSDPGKTPRKVEVTSTSHGNPVSGNKIGRGRNVTGDEAGTCKRVTGNEYVGAGQAESFCATKTEAGPSKVTTSETSKGKTLTGNNVGRSSKVTGDEPGAGRELTGTQYMPSGKGQAPAKVGSSTTLRGGKVSGSMVGRNERVTGDEPGSCRNVTGDDYIGQEQYRSFCDNTPQPQDRKVGVGATLTGKTVTGTMTGRSGKVTGDEPGTCKAVTGTPYAGAEQYTAYCQAEEVSLASARSRQSRGTPGAVMTGQQPGFGDKLTGAAKGACEPVSGTPYVGADQFAEACPATAAETNSPDFPQSLSSTPWGQFSVASPAGEARESTLGSVTGSRYEQGQITGPFGMASGKVTGTEEARFGQGQAAGQTSLPATAETIEGRIKSRITGEGMDAGPKITGDDWERGDNVTGTEGTSAIRRNPTLRVGSHNAMAMAPHKRNEEITVPSSKVTGGSGNTEKGALVTYSGGARG
ncbi:MAG: carboxysome shell protein [Thiotrichales bacterium SG8_50]|jgi:hypothetical protein|nr:MAG: carboxysome shell protein [Thiotrichales bacterium SG8_50]